MSECTASKPVSLESACPKTNMCGVSSYFEHFSLVKMEFIFFHSNFISNHGNIMEFWESKKLGTLLIYRDSRGNDRSVRNISYISIAFPIWWQYLSVDFSYCWINHTKLFLTRKNCSTVEITWKFVHLAFWMC